MLAALAGLRQLSTFHWLGAGSRLPPAAQLPGGAWLGSLRRLVAPQVLVARSLQALAAAEQLEYAGCAALLANPPRWHCCAGHPAAPLSGSWTFISATEWLAVC